MVTKKGRRVRIFSALEVSNICGVVNQTVINWIRNGYLTAFATPGGQYRVYAKDLYTFLEDRGMSASIDVLNAILQTTDWSAVLTISGDTDLNDKIHSALGEQVKTCKSLQAYDCFEAGLMLSGKKIGFIIIDGGIPGIDTAKMVDTLKNDPAFGRPFVIILDPKLGKGKETKAAEKADAVFPVPPDMEKLCTLIRETSILRTEAVNLNIT